MARTLQNTIDWSRPFVNYLPLNIGTNNEPAISNANHIKQLFLSPDIMGWSWNRGTASFQTVIGQQDYTETISDFGYLETASLQPCASITQVAGDGTTATITAPNAFVKGNRVTITGLTNTAFNVTNATITNATATQFQFTSSTSLAPTNDTGLAVSGQIFQISDVFNTEPLAESSDLQRPNAISVMVSADTGGFDPKFRFMGVPDATYNVVLNYQKEATAFSALTDQWEPIPDRYAYIYDRGFLAECLEPIDAARAQIEKQRFIMSLVSIAEGLELEDKAVFMAQYLNIDAQVAANMLDTQQGRAARAQQ
jgi:hypothetical protein